MTIDVARDGTLLLTGACPSDDAEPLLQQLLASPSAAIDWRNCVSAHSAVLQVLIVARRPMIGPPASMLLRQWVNPLLASDPSGNVEKPL